MLIKSCSSLFHNRQSHTSVTAVKDKQEEKRFVQCRLTVTSYQQFSSHQMSLQTRL